MDESSAGIGLISLLLLVIEIMIFVRYPSYAIILFGVLQWFGSAFVFVVAKSAIHEIYAAVLALCGTVAFCSGIIIIRFEEIRDETKVVADRISKMQQ